MTEEKEEMTKEEVALDNFQAIAQSLSDTDRKSLLGAFVDVLQAMKSSLDDGWEQMNFYDSHTCSECGKQEAGNFSERQAFLGVLERGAKKRTYQEIVDLLDQIIHPPEPEPEPEG